MIYLTGDTHGEVTRFDELFRQGEGTWTEDDVLIVTGDFGYVFFDNTMERLFLHELSTRPYTICFCDGNHENFTALESYPVEEWNGGKVHRIRRNILHLMRGQVYEIQGKTFFVMGGAYSIDRYMRTEGFSWWSRELPTQAECDEARTNLAAHGNEVDYIVTHTAPTRAILRLGYRPAPEEAPLTGFLDQVLDSVRFKGWFFGHFHEDRDFEGRFCALLFRVVTPEESFGAE